MEVKIKGLYLSHEALGASSHPSTAIPISGTLGGIKGGAHDYNCRINEVDFTGSVPYVDARTGGFLESCGLSTDQGPTRPWASNVPIGTQSPFEVFSHLLLRVFELLAGELESTRRRLEDKEKKTEELRAILKQSSRELMEKQAAHEWLREQLLKKDSLLSQLRAELLEAREKASSRDTLMQQNQILSQRIKALSDMVYKGTLGDRTRVLNDLRAISLSKENLSLVKHKREVKSLEVGLEEATTVIEVMKVQAGDTSVIRNYWASSVCRWF
ncbi:hypothetical protein Esti_001113 [Eimeria stiedai]